jgi:hypothetical protein
MRQGWKWGLENVISRHFVAGSAAPPSAGGTVNTDGRLRYDPALRERMYLHVIRAAGEIRPNLEIALCLEEPPLRRATGLEADIGRCNCRL